MTIRNATFAAAGLGLMGVLAVPVQAAPSAGAGLAATLAPSAVEKTNYNGRNCWRRNGKLYCQRYVRRGYPYAHNNDLGQSWGYGPGLGFYFGGGGNRGHWGGGHHGGHHGGHRR